MSHSSRRAEVLQLLDQLRRHLAAVEFTDRAYGTEITTTQASLLDELVRNANAAATDLAIRLCVHVSTVSRALSQLAALGFIVPSKFSGGGRIITSQGLHFARLQWTVSERFFTNGLSQLTVKEQRMLEEFLIVLLGHDPSENLTTLPQESTLSFIFRGLTYEHGVLSGNYLGSGYSVRDWFLLSEIYYNERSPSGLAAVMRSPPSSISVLLSGLKRYGLLSSSRDTLDSRVRKLALTEEGLAALHHIESCAQSLFEVALSSISKADVATYLDIFERYVDGIPEASRINLKCTEILSSELPALRVVAAKYMAQMGDYYPHTGYLLHPTNRIISISLQELPSLIVEITSHDNSSMHLVVNVIVVAKNCAKFSPPLVLRALSSALGAKIEVTREMNSFLTRLARWDV